MGMSGLAILIGAATLVFVVRRCLFVVTVEGSSMQPGLREGDRVVARRVKITNVRSGDVVVIRRPDESMASNLSQGSRSVMHSLLIKRVAAVPGDPVPRYSVPALASRPEDRVPFGYFVALGDNHRRSFDSKQIGYFSGDLLVGVVIRHISGVRTNVSG
jgi:signal peptidase I